MTKRTFVTVLAIVGTLVLGTGAYLAYTATPSGSGEQLVPNTSITFRSISSSQEAEGIYTIDITYPTLEGMTDSKAQQATNAALKAFALDPLEDFKEEAASSAERYRNLDDIIPSSYRVEYEPVFWSDELVSMKFPTSSYIAAAAHPYSYVRTFNYLVDKRHQMELQDLFAPGADFLSVLSELAREQLRDKALESGSLEAVDEMIVQGTLPVEENFEVFVLSPDGLRVFFNPYQAGPYAEGIKETFFRWEDLAEEVELSPFASRLVNR